MLRKIKVSKLSDEQISEMFSLFHLYYDDISPDLFFNDLKEKSHVLMIYHERRVVGFSTMLRKKFSTPNISITSLFTGDTVVRKDFWGSKALQRAFFWYILETKLIYFWRPMYWFLISKGYKTYLMMVTNFNESYPRRERQTPDDVKELQDRYYLDRYGCFYNKNLDIIDFKASKGSVKADFHDLSERMKINPDVLYFLQRNPRFADGVELACICKISFMDFFFHLQKYFLKFFK
ncbi:MAG: hypothetical protein A2504_17320 [Bdellovibrionales bacterium RIFOXYD12_FULL_39_22]|nr:MAG: hypothetical protein A2404_17250 [Bdellovibrionales bacterium RIFOXYC1_FULL_39_130]OFZ75020.1 MAG: hypothetical protein A2451_05670 [Bdellovibrionales bacterium RIFOXYC2_FULL_39_8]OFZ75838.1 MAG: hypothetical protein A2560_13750 [Bdellovibrionales bacterium RIFOXYD1_FULL_39_84]OFZ91899.1 MAG: hypothetical protein A2504_17320 [Bdellovibrionales bacterium RIFOXYD12_FULL_39_22]